MSLLFAIFIIFIIPALFLLTVNFIASFIIIKINKLFEFQTFNQYFVNNIIISIFFVFLSMLFMLLLGSDTDYLLFRNLGGLFIVSNYINIYIGGIINYMIMGFILAYLYKKGKPQIGQKRLKRFLIVNLIVGLFFSYFIYGSEFFDHLVEF